MATNIVSNWFGDIVSHPLVVVDATSVDDLIAILRDSSVYPSPVRVVGSNHSTTACGAADSGTLVRMKMNRLLSVGADTLTVEAGALHLQMAKALEAQKLQFYVNTEIGSLSAGSAACAGTKDASFPDEFGQVGSYITGVKMVLPNQTLLQVTEESQPDLIQIIRSSYGLLGIIYEVTFKIKPLTPMHVHHKTFELREFMDALPDLKQLGYSMMYYMFPFDNKITVEFRKYNPSATGEPNRCAWAIRNHIWGTSGPKLGHDVEQNFCDKDVRYGIIDGFNAGWRLQLENIVTADYTLPPDQIIDYPPVSNDSRYTFSLFAFPEDNYPAVLSDFFTFCRDYYSQKGYRSNLLYVGYRIAEDQKSMFSYSGAGNVMTIDPVSTANPGWDDFLLSYNQFCSDRNGIPLLNQTPSLSPAIVQKAYGEKLLKFNAIRKQYDPTDRLLNDYFRTLLG
jgi:hypothetical protein